LEKKLSLQYGLDVERYCIKKDQDVAAIGVVTEAIEIQENVSIQEDKVTIPSDVKVKVLDPRALSNG
jgi:hypothetical protein